jgi:hypothetical protein
MGIALFGLLRKELVQFFRDRLILTLILWLYTIEVVICAVALSFDVSHLPLAVVDEDRSALSRSLIQKFAVSETFDLKFQETRVATATDLARVLSSSSSRTAPIPTLPPMPSMMLCRSSSARSAKRSLLPGRRGARYP